MTTNQFTMLEYAIKHYTGRLHYLEDHRILSALTRKGYIAFVVKCSSGFNYKITNKGINAALTYAMKLQTNATLFALMNALVKIDRNNIPN